MKILFLTNNLFGKDGWSRYSLDLISALNDLGIKALCLVSEKKSESKIKQIKVLRKPLKYFTFPLRLIFDFWKIRKIIKKEKPDIIHFLVEPYLFFLPFINFKNTKYFITVHGTYAALFFSNYKWEERYHFLKNILLNFSHKISRHWIKICLNIVDQIISVSNYTKEKMLLKSPLDLKDKIAVVSNGVDFSNAVISNPTNKIKSVVFLGAVTERKGVLEALKALKIYKEQYSDNFVFNIMGSYQSESRHYQNFVEKFNLKKNVKFWGRISEEKKDKFLKNADLFIMLSKILDGGHFEGFGLVYLEANKYGVPVIGPNIGGPIDAIKNGISGFQVDVFDSKEVALKIDLVLNGGVIKKENCFEWARKNDIVKKAKIIKNIYSTNL